MKAFKKLIEFVTRQNKHFYNRDIKCPVCGETLWFDDSQAEVPSDRNKLRLVCKNNCCTMEIEYERHIWWDDEI